MENMSEIIEALNTIFNDNPFKIVISKPISKNEKYKKITVEKKGNYFQISSFTEKQVFHSNVNKQKLLDSCTIFLTSHYGNLNAWVFLGVIFRNSNPKV